MKEATQIVTGPFLQAIEAMMVKGPVVVVSDETVGTLYGKALCSHLGEESLLLTFPPGDLSKTRSLKEHLENKIFEKGWGKDTTIIGIGGGVVTDMAGFMALTYCRGVPLILIPTTLLAMVDAGLGGKNGVNTPYGKNLVGGHYDALKIIIDPLFLKTLPLKELKNGFSETLKHALLQDKELFCFLEEHREQLLRGDENALSFIIKKSMAVKLSIVQKDPLEKGMRRLLNLGHTVAHAMEQYFEYEMSHGEAVAFGLLVESFIAHQLGYLSLECFERVQKIILDFKFIDQKKYHLLSEGKHDIERCQKIVDMMTLDKKSKKGQARFVFISDIASPLSFKGDYCIEVPSEMIFLGLKEMGL